jgi:hypothetical protein
MTEHSDAENGTPAVQLRFLIGKFGPNEQNLIRAIRSAMRKRLPTANELVYDYTTFFVVSYSATEHPSDAIAATAARPDGMRLNLMNKQPLPDPNKLLTGSGKRARPNSWNIPMCRHCCKLPWTARVFPCQLTAVAS